MSVPDETRQPEVSRRLAAMPPYPLADVPIIKRRLLAEGVDVIDLGAGDNDMPPPEPVIEALREAALDPRFSKYGFQQGLPEFRRAAADYVARRFGHRFDPDTEVLPLLGSKEGLAHLPAAFVNPGEVVIVPEPGYQGYLGGALLSDAERQVVPLEAERGFLLELESLPAEVLARSRVAYVNYPNNPTAAVAGVDYLERLVGVARRHGILIAYDNAYCDLTYDGYQAPSIFDVAGAREVALEFFSLSKSFSMTGWRLGFVVGRRELIAALTRIKTYVDTGPFLAVQAAGAVALDRAEEFVAPVRDTLRRRRDAGVQALVEQWFESESPKAAMYLWIPVGIPAGSRDFARVALEREGVVVLPGRGFGPAGEGYFRIALTVEPPRLVEAIGRLGRVRSGWEARPTIASV
ncbi:MAG: aminotransferase class I/II-fold pyridoxal phosphate-dependent enzyme [Gemmatimonadales bacterium]